MKKRRRIEAVQKQLTPLQVVLLDIEEAHRLGSMEAFARSLASGDKKPKRVELVAEMTRNRCRGMDEESIRQQVRDAQKEAMFLHRLAVETWSSILTNERAWGLTAAAIGLLHAMAVDMVNGEKEPIEAIARVITAWHDAARSHRMELETELEAARLIEREYFGGAKILFERDRAMLVEMIGSAERNENVSSSAKRVLDHEPPADATTEGGAEAGGDEDATRVRAASLANRRADLARVHVHDRFSEERKAGAILKGVLAVG